MDLKDENSTDLQHRSHKKVLCRVLQGAHILMVPQLCRQCTAHEQGEPFNVVIMDMQMAGMDGCEATRSVCDPRSEITKYL